MDNHPGKALTKREIRRRRRLNEERCETDAAEKQLQAEGGVARENSRILARRNTFTVAKSSTSDNSLSTCGRGDVAEVATRETSSLGGSDGVDDVIPQTDADDSKMLTHTMDTWNTDSAHLTYDVNDDDDDGTSSKNDTYSVHKMSATGAEEYRPIPAPRKRLAVVAVGSGERERHSSDTDRDVVEIEVDDDDDDAGESGSKSVVAASRRTMETMKMSSHESSDAPVAAPRPKPRKLSARQIAQTSFRTTESVSKSKSLEEITVKVASPRSIKSNPETKCEDFPKDTPPHPPPPPPPPPAVKTPPAEKPKRGRKFSNLLQRRKKRGRSFAKLDNNARIPTLSSILRDLRDESRAGAKEDDDKTDFPIDSTCFPRSELNDKMYVQGRNGFYLKSREDVFKLQDDAASDRDAGTGEGSMTTAMLRTAMLFQKFWSRSMMYFHGVLAGFGFGHAFTVTTILFFFNQESQRFVDVYACLALKIHFIFYSLIALCIISCLDRLDVGHLKREHWERIFSKFPSLWFILMMYVASFALTFANHSAEARFDDRRYANATSATDDEVYKDGAETFASWYRIIWARDMMVLAAWLLISLTEYPDHLHAYLINLAAKSELDKDAREQKLLSVIS